MSEARASSRLDSLLTGLFYLALAIAGGIVFLAIRPALFVAGEPAQTAANLAAQAGTARAGVALELATVTFQALAAVWFARLFRPVDAVAAFALAAFGMVNAIAILASSAFLRAALDAALGVGGGDPTLSHLLMLISGRFWDAGGVFFGLWLIPMGWLVMKGRYGPRILGWILIVGGLGYVASSFVGVLAPQAVTAAVALPLLATIGEFWMILLLLWKGLRPARAA
jgi:hypothetical protein